MDVQPITHLTFEMLQPLLGASLAEGYDFIQKLWDEYESGETTFCDHGAVLIGIIDHDQLIAVGGVHQDPYLQFPSIGRIRHVYVLPGYRRKGTGRRLVQCLVEYGTQQFTILTLRTLTEHGDAFYRTIGFSSEPRFANATHWMECKQVRTDQG